jgi:hypothetical protein
MILMKRSRGVRRKNYIYRHLTTSCALRVRGVVMIWEIIIRLQLYLALPLLWPNHDGNSTASKG